MHAIHSMLDHVAQGTPARWLGGAIIAAFMAAQASAGQAGPDIPPGSDRIVSVGGSITEIIYALGQQDRLVARDSTSVYPPASAALPEVGYMRALSPEGVLSFEPDAIIAIEGSGPREAFDVLERARIPIVTIPDIHSREGIVDKIERIGTLLGVEAEAGQLARRVAADIRAAEAAGEGIAEPKRVLFILSLQGGKILGAGSATAASGIITMAGGVNAVTGFAGYKQVSDEAVIRAQPEIILMMDRGGEHGMTAKEVFAHPALASTPAGQARRLVMMDGAYLLGFGPRTASVIRELSDAFYHERK